MANDKACAPASTTLLSQSLEVYQAITIGSRTIVITVLDNLSIGEGTDFGADYSAFDLCLYGEVLTLSGTFRLKSGILSAQLIQPVGDAVISMAGARGTSPSGANQDPAAKGASGGPGQSGGSFNLYLGMASGDLPSIRIDASGGAGGAGQTGLQVAAGGDGGNGGGGGTVIYLAGLMANAWLDSLQDAAKLETVQQQQLAISTLLEGASTVPSTNEWSAVSSALKDATAPSATEQQVRADIERAALALTEISQQYAAHVVSLVDIAGGAYGPYGVGRPNGINGAPGPSGALTTVLFGAPADLATTSFSPFFLIHPSQCARLLNQAELMYLVLDPVKAPQGVSDLMTILTRLQQRTQLFVEALSTSELIDFYNLNESAYGAIGSVQQLIDINGQAESYLSQVKSGLDLFGYDSNGTPLGSFSTYSESLNKLIDNFATLERAYEAYFAALASNTATVDQINAARDQQNQVTAAAQQEIAMLSQLATQTAEVIDTYQTILPPLKEALEEQLEALEDAIESHFDFNFQTFLSAMTTMAFAPESKLMLMTQATNLLYSGAKKVTNIQGVPVNKNYVISQLVVVESNVDSINEGFEQLQNGTLKPDDPGAGKLIAEEKAFLSFISQFETTFPDEVGDAVDAFNAYISAITQRNNQILTYNSTLLLIARQQAAIAAAKTRNATLNQQLLSTLSPTLPDLVSYVSSLYYAARNQVLQTLDLTSRAYRFWALSSVDLMQEAFGNTPPPKINTAVLRSAQNIIIGACDRALESFGTNASAFPADPRQQGIVFELIDSRISNLKRGQSMSVMYQPTTVLSTTTKEKSPLAGMANIRVGKVRVWVDGAMTSDEELTVTITQTGHEQIVSTGDQVFSFTHEPLTKLFIYKISTGKIVEEADFGIAQISGSSQQVYAAIGPFAVWHIQVLTKYNRDLDLSGVTGVRLEFHGTNFAFNS